MKFQIIENSVSWLPTLKPENLPKKLPNSIQLHIASGQLGLEAKGVVGTIPLANNDVVVIKPKIGDVNFLQILSIAQGEIPVLEHELEDLVQYSTQQDSNISDIIAEQIFLSANEILRKSLLSNREKRKSEVAYFKGRVNFIATASRIANKSTNPVVTTLKPKVLDIPENRLIACAMQVAWPWLNRAKKEKHKAVFYQWQKRFYNSDSIHSDIQIVEEKLSSHKYGGVRSYYRPAMLACQVLFGIAGLSMSGMENSLDGSPILMNSADIFEKFIRNVIARNYNPKGFIINSENGAYRYMYLNGGFELRPDITIEKNNEVRLIVDAKYKKPDSSDHYQIAAYLEAYNLQKGVLISPNFESQDTKIQTFKSPNGKEVKEVYISLANIQNATKELGNILDLVS